MQNLKTIGSRLKYAIRLRFSSQRKLSQGTETDQTLISHYCNDRKIPSPVKIIKISSFLNISPHWLRDGIGTHKDNFNDYVFSEVKNNPEKNITKFKLIEGSNDTYELTIVLEKPEIKFLFDRYEKII